ncbi:MAG: hypothetical protein ACE5HP_12760 [Gemmatimonadota bacterium]
MSARGKTVSSIGRGSLFLTGVVVAVPLVLFEYLRAVLAVSGGAGA